MKKTIINECQLENLISNGIVYKNADDCYYPLIDKDRWSEVCMPCVMVDDVIGKTLDIEKVDDLRWHVEAENGDWFIGPWMLNENYEELIKQGKFIPEPWSHGKYILHIMSKAHLEDLYNKDILSKRTYGDNDYVYEACFSGMGDMSFPDAMVDQIAGKTMHCYKPGGSRFWVEEETEHRWSISEWMLEENYEYLLKRLKGELDIDQLEPEGEEEPDDDEEEEEEEEIPDWCEASIVGVIEETNPEYITINCSEMSVPVLCYGDAKGHGILERVKVRGKLMRVHNMMGYPEIDINYIEEY